MNLKERKGKTQLIKKQLTKFDKKKSIETLQLDLPKNKFEKKNNKRSM